MNNVNMNVNGVNSAAAMNAMANGTNGVARNATNGGEMEYKLRLNTYIYDYLLKNGEYDVARALNKSSLSPQTDPNPPRKPKDEGGEDSKDDIDTKKPADLPYPAGVPPAANESFLLDWFQLFWEMWFTTQPSLKGKITPDAQRYMEYTKAQNKMRQEATQMLQRPGMMAGGMAQNYGNMMRVGQPAMMQNEMARRAQQNNIRNMSGQQQMMLARHMAQQQAMEREGSGVDMGARPRTPSSGDNAPSPPKRQRIEGQFPQQAMANGRFAPGMPDPTMLSTTNFNQFQQQPPNMQKRNLETYSQTLTAHHQRQNLPQGMNGMTQQMMQPGIDQIEFYGNNGMRPGVAQNGGGQGSSNHALQDYQMQLMLLEQQNKKRLLMARQEQDGSMGRPDQGPGMPGQPGFAPAMSPSGSRNGPSPNPSEQQMKRGTPKMGQAGLPGSPMPTEMPHGRGSPGAMNFNGGMSMEMMQQMKGMEGMPMGQNGMRPPSSHPPFNGGPVNVNQMEQIRQAQAQQGRQMPNGANWPQAPQGQAPGVPQAAPPQNGQIGTPRNGNAAMPPPQNVPAANNNTSNNASNVNGRPASPAQQPAQAGTPQQAPKPAPKKSKAKEDRKRPAKKNTATAATPSADGAGDPPPTPTPATPITPNHPESFNKAAAKNNAAVTQPTTAQANNNVPAPAPQMPQAQDANNMLGFEGMDGLDASGMNMQFGSMDTGDVLENFDFDAFLESGEGNELNFENLGYGNFDGVEAAIGE